MYNNILLGAGNKSLELNFPKIDFVVDDMWDSYPLKLKLYYELHWRIMLKRLFSRVCFPISYLAKCNPQKYNLILGDIFRREDLLPLAKKYGYVIDENLFEGFALSPQFCKKFRGRVTSEDVHQKDYEEDNKKCMMMANLISENIYSVCDLGSGNQVLKTLLPKHIKYIGVDYIDKGQEYIIDFNNDEFPNVSADCFFGCGILEFIDDYHSFLESICQKQPKIIILSYSVREFSSFSTYRSPVYHNCIYSNEITSIICGNGYRLEEFIRYESRQAIFKFVNITPIRKY